MDRQKEITQAYWSPERVADDPEHNPSADRVSGDAFVDTLTIGELVEFFDAHESGPTYCMVKQRLEEMLDKLPPRLNILKAKDRATRALETLRGSLNRLMQEVGNG